MSAFQSKKYMWRPGFGYKVDANIVGEVLERIEERDGEVTTRSFLDESRPEDSPTHSLFEWDDSIAAEKFRMKQSSDIFSQLTYEWIVEEDVVEEVELMEVDEEDISVPVPMSRAPSAYTNISNSGWGSTATAIYVSSDRAMQDTTMRSQVLKNYVRSIKIFISRYREFEEFSKIFDAVEEVEKELNEEE